MYVCAHTHSLTHPPTYTYTYIHKYIQTSIHPSIHTYIHTYIHCRSSPRGASRSGSSRGGDRFHGSRPIQVGGERVPRGNGRICTWSPRPPVLSHLLLFPCTFRFSFTRCRARAERDKPESVLAVLVHVLRFLCLQWQSSTCLGSNSADSTTPEASSYKTACSGCLPFVTLLTQSKAATEAFACNTAHGPEHAR